MANARARALRKLMTAQEVKLWVQLRTLRAEGHHHTASDKQRDEFLAQAGYRVLRFWNNEIDGELAGVMQVIADALAQKSTPPGRCAATLP